MDDDDVAQVVASLRQALAAEPSNAREAVKDFGWGELLAEEPQVAIRSLFALSGELLTHGSNLDTVLLHAGGFEDLPQDTRVVLPPLGTHLPKSRHAEGAIAVDGIVQQGSGQLLVPCTDAGGTVSFHLTDSVEPAAVDALDPTAWWIPVAGSTPVVASSVVDDIGAEADHRWASMLAAGRRALTHELTAVSGRMLAMTVEHVTTRKQFGRTLGSFQAVGHQLADVKLWHEVAQLSAEAAWEDSSAHSAALAKAAAIRSSRTARAICQQLLGGMGFTWEHEFHRYLRRALTVEPLLGSAADIHGELGRSLRAGDVDSAMLAL